MKKTKSAKAKKKLKGANVKSTQKLTATAKTGASTKPFKGANVKSTQKLTATAKTGVSTKPFIGAKSATTSESADAVFKRVMKAKKKKK